MSRRRLIIHNYLPVRDARFATKRTTDCGSDSVCSCDACRSSRDAPTLTKEQAGYVDPAPGANHCGACSMFRPAQDGQHDDHCTLVIGAIEARAVCRKFEARAHDEETAREKALRILRGSPSGITEERFAQLGVSASLLQQLVKEGKARRRVVKMAAPAGLVVPWYYPT